MQEKTKCPLIDGYRWMYYTPVEYYSEKEQKSAFCNNVDRPREYYAYEISQRKTNTPMLSLTSGI